MDDLYEMLQFWHIKLLLGGFLLLFSPLKLSIIIMFVLVFIDTLTGTISALRAKRFNSRLFKKNVKKIFIYSLFVITMRLLEVGIIKDTDFSALTHIGIAFLIITEASSIFENLAMIGLPVSTKFINIIYKRIRLGDLEKVLNENLKERRNMADIEDILYFQVPLIKSAHIKRMIEIQFEVCIRMAEEIMNYFDMLNGEDNDLVYYKVRSIIQFSYEEVKQNWNEEDIPKNCIDNFISLNEVRLIQLLESIREVCYNTAPPSMKREEVIKKITIYLYQIVLDSLKYSSKCSE